MSRTCCSCLTIVQYAVLQIFATSSRWWCWPMCSGALSSLLTFTVWPGLDTTGLTTARHTLGRIDTQIKRSKYKPKMRNVGWGWLLLICLIHCCSGLSESTRHSLIKVANPWNKRVWLLIFDEIHIKWNRFINNTATDSEASKD